MAHNTAHLTDLDIDQLRVILLEYTAHCMVLAREVETAAYPMTGARDLCVRWAKAARRIQTKLRVGDRAGPGG